MAQSPKGRLVRGLYKPIHGDCAMWLDHPAEPNQFNLKLPTNTKLLRSSYIRFPYHSYSYGMGFFWELYVNRGPIFRGPRNFPDGTWILIFQSKTTRVS